MNTVATVLAELASNYLKTSREADSETRLLLPGLTENIAEIVHGLLFARGERSYLVIPERSELTPNQKKGFILADGLTSLREGEMLIIAFPGQISRIQDSIVGSGGTVRGQSFSDEWPWISLGENPTFSFSEAFLPRLMAAWKAPATCESWLREFISQTLMPHSAGILRKGEIVLEDSLGKFSALSSEDELDDSPHFIPEFLKHCGFPKPPELDMLTETSAKSYGQMLSKLTKGVSGALERGTSRSSVMERVEQLAREDPKLRASLTSAVDDIFDSLGSKDHIPLSIFLFRSFFRSNPKYWPLLDMDLLSKLFLGTGINEGVLISDIDVSLGEGDAGRVIPKKANTNIYSVHGCALTVRVVLNRKPETPTNLSVVVRGRELAKTEFLDDSPESTLEFDTRGIGAHSRQIVAKVEIRSQDAVTADASHNLRLNLVGEDRPILGLLLESEEIVDDPIAEESESSLPRIDVDEPQLLEVLCSESSVEPTVSIDSIESPMHQIGESPCHFAAERAVDPAADLSSDSLVRIEQGGHSIGAYIGMEEVKRGEFTIEEELRELLHLGRNKTRIRQVLSVFNGSTASAYPHLGGIEGKGDRARVEIARKVLENQASGGLPILIDVSRTDFDLASLSLGSHIMRSNDDEVSKRFDTSSLLPSTKEYVQTYREARNSLVQELGQRIPRSGTHPLYASSPVFFAENSIELALSTYLDAYKDCVDGLERKEELRNKNDKFILSWLDCIVCLDRDERVPTILIGPWHPLVLVQRYMVQACLYDAASRFIEGHLGERLHRLAPLLADVVGCRWMPFAAPQNPMTLGTFHVSATSDPGWLIAVSPSHNNTEPKESYIERVERELGISVANQSEVAPRDIEGYVRSFLKAHPSRRSVSLWVDSDYSPVRFMRSARNLTDALERDFGRQLPGGLHLVFEDEPKELDDVEWKEPPVLAYHAKGMSEGKSGYQKDPIDIHLLQGKKLTRFEVTEEVSPPPRGDGLHAVFYEPLRELNVSGRAVYTSLHDCGVGEEEDLSELGSRYRSTLSSLNRAQSSKYLSTTRPGKSEIESPWVITPAEYVDPAAMTALAHFGSPERADAYVLWDYRLELSGSHGGYFTLSRVHGEIEAILSGNALLAEGETAKDILIELGKVGIALGGEVVRSNTTAQGALGLVGALRLFQGTESTSGVLKNGTHSVAFILPVDSFEEVFRALESSGVGSDKRTDLLAVQIDLGSNGSEVRISFLGIEAKYVSATLGRERAKAAATQASVTVRRITELARRGRSHGLERQALLRLISHGLRLSAPGRGQGSEVDSQVLGSILRGNYDVVEVSPSTFVVSSELGFTGKAKIETTPSAWIRLSPGHWPTPHKEPSSELAKVIEQLALFSSSNWESINEAESREPTEETPKVIASGSDEEGQGTFGLDGREKTGTPSSAGKVGPGGSGLNRSGNVPVPEEKSFGDLQGVEIPVGSGTDWPNSGESVVFSPSNTELTQLNVGIVGDLGTGKTQKIKALVRDLSDSAESNRGQRIKFLIFDYKGDYVGPEFVQRTAARVVTPQNIPLNVLDPRGAEGINAELDRANFLIDVIRKIYGGIGPTQEYNLRAAIGDCYSSCKSLGIAPTIYDVCDRYAKSLKNPDSVLSILSNLTSYRLFERDQSRIQDFSDFFEGVTVIDLKSLGTWDQGKNMLVVMFLSLYYDYMLHVDKKPFIGQNPQLRAIDSFLLVDEADQIMRYEFPILRRILLQGREFGIGVILASQYLSHFRADKTNYLEPLLTWILHRVPNLSAKELAAIGLTDAAPETAEKIKNLSSHHSFYKSSIGQPCFMKNVTFFE